jgi:hypothetical protein
MLVGGLVGFRGCLRLKRLRGLSKLRAAPVLWVRAIVFIDCGLGSASVAGSWDLIFYLVFGLGGMRCGFQYTVKVVELGTIEVL